MDKRTALVVKKDLPPGQLANVSAILMAEIVRLVPETMSADPVIDQDGIRHAGPVFSVIALRANGAEQLQNTVNAARATHPELVVVVFSAIGQGLNNAFGDYKARIASLHTQSCGLVGIAICGDDPTVREVTKKFSIA